MVLTSFPTEQGDGKVLVEITADTVCEVGDVFKGDQVVVTFGDWLKLKHANKAVLASVAVAPQNEAVEEPVAEVEPQAEVAEISDVAADVAEAPAAPRKGRR